MADTKLTIEQSMEQMKIQTLRDLVDAVQQLAKEVQAIRVQVTNIAAKK